MVSAKPWTLAACLVFGMTASCEKKEAAPSATASASASTVAQAPSAKPPEKPWFSGTWEAPLEVERTQIEQTKQEGKIEAWANDKGDKATGPGKLVLKIDDAGKVTGEVTGALGTLEASGTVDGDALRVRLSSTERAEPAQMFNGVLLATKSNGGFSGELKASSGDSLTVRKAAVVLAKQGGDTSGTAGKNAAAPAQGK